MNRGTPAQVLPVEAGSRVAVPLNAIESIQRLELNTTGSNGTTAASSGGPSHIIDLHHLMWGAPPPVPGRYVLIIQHPDLRFGLLVQRVLTARLLDRMIGLPRLLRSARTLFKGLMRDGDDVIPVLDIERLAEFLKQSAQGEDHDLS